jgi:hypothetical protein
VKLRKAIRVTVEDWLRPDPDMDRYMWIGFTLAILPMLPLVIAWRVFQEEPERLS